MTGFPRSSTALVPDAFIAAITAYAFAMIAAAPGRCRPSFISDGKVHTVFPKASTILGSAFMVIRAGAMLHGRFKGKLIARNNEALT